MKSKKRISKLLVASLLSYGLSQGCLNNFNVVRGMEDDEEIDQEELQRIMAQQRERMRQQREQLARDARNHMQQLAANDNRIQDLAPTNDEIKEAEKKGLAAVRDRFYDAIKTLNDENAENDHEATKVRIQWMQSVCFGEWKLRNRIRPQQIFGQNHENYNKPSKIDPLRPIDGARRFCYCGKLLNSRFKVISDSGEEILGSKLPNKSELIAGGLALGECICPCGHVAHTLCVNRTILDKAVTRSAWGHGSIDWTCPVCDKMFLIQNQDSLNSERIKPGLAGVMWYPPDNRSLELPDQIHGNTPPRLLWMDRMQKAYKIPEEDQINEHGRFLRLPQERREQIEREKAERERLDREKEERERVERERIAEEARLAEKARKAAEEKARLEDEANDFLNVMGDFAEANENERKADEEKRILAEIERGFREKAEAERREEEARIARERRKEEENARLRTTSSPAPTVSTTTNFSAAPSLAAMTALTTLPTMSLSNVATPSISATTPALQTTTVNATNAPAAPVATNNINNAGTPSGNINAVTPNGVNSSTSNTNVSGTNQNISNNTEAKHGSTNIESFKGKINNLEIDNKGILTR